MSSAIDDPVIREQYRQLANTVRRGKAQIKSDLAELPRMDALELAARMCENPEGVAGALKVRELIYAIPRHRAVALQKACRAAGIVNADRKLRELTFRQRHALAGVLRERSLIAYGETEEGAA